MAYYSCYDEDNDIIFYVTVYISTERVCCCIVQCTSPPRAGGGTGAGDDHHPYYYEYDTVLDNRHLFETAAGGGDGRLGARPGAHRRGRWMGGYSRTVRVWTGPKLPFFYAYLCDFLCRGGREWM